MKRFDFKALAKKFIKCTAAAVLSLAFILSGCSDKSAVSSDALPVIIIGSDEYEPYNFSDKNGNPAGIDVEIASEAFLRMGYKAQFKNIVWDEKDEMLADGKVDCLWGCFSMNGREDKYRWVGPYMNSRQAVAVRTEYIFAALRKNYVDAVAGHEYMLRVFINESDNKYRLLDESLLLSKLGIAFAKDNDSALPEKLKATLYDMKNDGTLAQIAVKYGLDPNTALGGITLE